MLIDIVDAETTSLTAQFNGAQPAPVGRHWPIKIEHKSTGIRFRPEDSPFRTLFVDITHRCNMACRNCYIPNRDIEDMPTAFLYDVLSRLPRRTRIRLVGAEPTLREDLPEIIAQTRRLGHLPVILSNGLRLVNRRLVERLKAAGLRTVYLSMNGGIDDQLYLAIDDLACAKQKMRALEQLSRAKMHVTVGMILVRGVNDSHLPDFLSFLDAYPQVGDIHVRSVGKFGSYMDTVPYLQDELNQLVASSVSGRFDPASARTFITTPGKRIEITQWPELGSRGRGRLTPDGFVEPFFEHVIENTGGY